MAINSVPPHRRIQNSSRMRNCMTKLILKPAMAPYTVSAVAAPRPDIRPAVRPFERVREMHKTFTGPTGAEMANPASIPLESNSRSLHWALGICMARPSIIPVNSRRRSGRSLPLCLSSVPSAPHFRPFPPPARWESRRGLNRLFQPRFQAHPTPSALILHADPDDPHQTASAAEIACAGGAHLRADDGQRGLSGVFDADGVRLYRWRAGVIRSEEH